MSNRAERRAAERASNPNISASQLHANRANAQMSTGPTSPQGKATSSLNAVKTGLTGQTVLLPTDDAIIYQQHLASIFAQFAPATDQEKALVQTIADTEWRLLRIFPLETGIYAIGLRELADLYPDEPNPANRQALIQAEIFRTYRRELNNLALQERRLRNHHKADTAELQALQQARLEKEQSAAKKKPAAKPTPNGFVFSAEDSLPKSAPTNTPDTSNESEIGDTAAA